MEKIILKPGSLPQLPGAIKDLVNWREWHLYSVSYEGHPEIKYSLTNEEGEFLLDNEGSPISKIAKMPDGFEYLGECQFEGIPMPPTINMPQYANC